MLINSAENTENTKNTEQENVMDRTNTEQDLRISLCIPFLSISVFAEKYQKYGHYIMARTDFEPEFG